MNNLDLRVNAWQQGSQTLFTKLNFIIALRHSDEFTKTPDFKLSFLFAPDNLTTRTDKVNDMVSDLATSSIVLMLNSTPKERIACASS